MPPIISMEITTHTNSKKHYLIEQILSYKTLFFDVVTTIGYALSPAMNKSLHAALCCCSSMAKMRSQWW